MKIDMYTHVTTEKWEDEMRKRAIKANIVDPVGVKRVMGDHQITMRNAAERLRIVNKYEGLVQVITPTLSPLELIAKPDDAAYLAKLYNDEMAAFVNTKPEKFIAAVACLPLNNVKEAVKEIDRTVGTMGFKGILMHTPIYDQSIATRKAMDSSEFIPIYEKMLEYDLPIWIHPRREATIADYSNEEQSLWGMNHVFGWPYETSLAMGRIVFSGLLEKYPNLKFITHHCGAMIPFLANRIADLYDYWQATGADFCQNLRKPPIEYFKMFYNDTAVYGNTSALMCGYALFGADHIIFGTDFPYDSEKGDKFIRKTMEAIEGMSIPDSEKEKIFFGNAAKLLKIG